MDDGNPIIYGLEFQARALASQLAESDAVRFMVGTQSLKLSNNQVHIVEMNEENGALSTQVYQHSEEDNMCCMRSAIWRIPPCETDTTPAKLEQLTLLETEEFGQDVKMTVFHPTEGSKAVTVVNNHFIQWDLAAGDAKLVCSGTMEGKGQPRFTVGKWNPHQNCTQFVTVNEGHVKSWDLRNPNKQVWSIEAAHSQVVRDLDFNPNKQYYMATCGDDGCSKFWDVRNSSEPVVTRSDHSHWVWSIRYNHFHDQLVLTSSSDSQVILTSVASISSEPLTNILDSDENQREQKDKLEDGVLATYDEHEDSVYSVEWSSADPWTFASLSYDGRLVINKVSRADKYRILL
uniref:EIPR1-like beta-propeller domain-containing protein n=2 Tax=Timema TaxID=61471 RepID=A0A7R9IS94_9NEOP|nr:unnamed protein product [Timema bartmani]CAD7463673.1 unnamed protein product [Timema tahoe]